MVTIVQSFKKGYKIFFCDDAKGGKIKHVGTCKLEQTSKGLRPSEFFVRRPKTSHVQKTPTKDLIAVLRANGEVLLTESLTEFQDFLSSMQIQWRKTTLCRTCLFDDCITPLNEQTMVRCGNEFVCLDCAKRELYHELAHIKKLGKRTQIHIESLLTEYRDLDMVFAILQPESLDMKKTIFDYLEADEQVLTERLENLPLPREFVDVTGVETLMPAQQLAVEAGLLYGKDLLVVAATASGKTFIGEMAGLKNIIENRGKMLFLVPLVALANQKYDRFSEKYKSITKTSILTGTSRLNLPETKPIGNRGTCGDIVVGTYEGIDSILRKGMRLNNIGTVVIDEVQMLEDAERGHRLDGLISRLKYIAPQAQFLYLSATIGSPNILAKKLHASFVSYAERPVALERHLIFTEKAAKVPYIKRLVSEEFNKTSSKGYRGQTIIFTNARSRCHILANSIGSMAAPYHAGLTSQERRQVEEKFEEGKLACVVTTAALAAGVNFPASQVIFDALAMGINWISVQEFHQMMGRAGRPDFHDIGRVVLLAELGASYSHDTKLTEEEVAIQLLKGKMEEVAPFYEVEEASEEFVANAVIAHGNEKEIIGLSASMVGEEEDPLPEMIKHKLVVHSGGTLELSPLGRVMAEHFIGMNRILAIDALVREMDDPLEIIAELATRDEKINKHEDKKEAPEKQVHETSRELSNKKQESSPWIAQRRNHNAILKYQHTKERIEHSSTSDAKMHHHERSKTKPMVFRRATKEQEGYIERKKREANKFIPSPKRKQSNEWDAIEAGINARRTGKYDEALTLLSAWVKKHPRDSRALTELGKVYDLRGSRDDAFTYYQKAASANPQNSEAIDRINAYLIGITVEIDNEDMAMRISTDVRKRRKNNTHETPL